MAITPALFPTVMLLPVREMAAIEEKANNS
jgi:hypothetical protein